MRTYVFGVAAALLFSGCASAVDESSEQEPVAESVSAITQTGTAKVTVTSEWATGYCANVEVKNTGANQSNSWFVTLAMGSAKFTSGWEANFSQYKTTLEIRPSATNGAIAAGATANPVPGFCAERPAGTPLPTVQRVTVNYCGMAYVDHDSDGFGTGPLVYTCDATGYATKNGDCCDSDRAVFPGQTQYFPVPSVCASFDYSCDGTVRKKSNGPTGCYEAPMTCKLSADRSTCIASGSPAGCNGGFTSYGTATCGQDWFISSKGCTRVCSGASCWCTGWSNGGPGGKQACN
jgi:hypothetical protein